MDIELPILYYFEKEVVKKNDKGEDEIQMDTFTINGLCTVNPLDIVAVSSAPGTQKNVKEVSAMRCSRIWLKSGYGLDVNLPYGKMVEIWEKGKKDNYKIMITGIRN